MRMVEDGDPFNAGWNACLEELVERIKKFPTEKVADDGIRTLIPKCDVLEPLQARPTHA